jgi:hypothetical protein
LGQAGVVRLPPDVNSWFEKSFRIGSLAAASLVVVISVVVAISRFQVVNDDAFITFVHAKTLLSGGGLAFNAAERVLGTTAPLWAVTLAGASAIVGVPVPVAAKYLTIASIVGASLLVGDVLALHFGRAVLVFLVPALLFNYSVHWATGNETGLLYLIVAAAVWFSVRGRRSASYFCAALGFLCRGEAILLIPIVWFVHRSRGVRSSAQEFVPALVLLSAWVAFAWTYYGAVLPNTLIAKTAERTTTSFFESLPAFFGTVVGIRELGGLMVGPTVVGAALLVTYGPRELWIWPAAHVVGYSVLGAGSHPWYYHSLGWVWALSIAVCASTAVTRGAGLGRRVLCAAMAMAAAWQVLTIARLRPDDANRYACYQQVAHVISADLAAADEIVSQEIGILGYALPNRVLDMDFLVHRRPKDLSRSERVRQLIVTHRPKFLVTTAFRRGADTIGELQVRYPDAAPLRLTLREVVSVDGYSAAIYVRAGG